MNVAAQSARTSKLLSHVEAGTIELLDDDDLIKELRTAQLRLSGGRWLLSAPEKRNAHDDVLDCLLIACEHSEALPLGGAGDIRSTRVNGIRSWYCVHPDGTSTPSHPPVGSRDFLVLCHRARTEGFTTPEIEAFMSEPGNVEAVDAFQARMLGAQAAINSIMGR